jgi:flagellar biosynthesis chaperone FliJ
MASAGRGGRIAAVTLLDLLKAKWTIYGLDAPAFAWLAALGLLVGTLYALGKLAWLVRRECAGHRAVIARLEGLRGTPQSALQEGLPRVAYDELAALFAAHPSLALAWQRFAAQLVTRRSVGGELRLWSPGSAEAAFNEAAVIEPGLNRRWFTAVPGIVTGAGLLVTFLAILVALLDVRIVDNRVQGIDTLIQGLSGKFISSIAALGAATLYLLLEKPLWHRLASSHRRLVAAIDALVPRLSAARLLVDVQHSMAEQTAQLQQANVMLPLRLQQGISDVLQPPLQRLAATLADVEQHLATAERSRQDVIVDSLGALVSRLEEAITSALGDIGSRFSEALSGSAQQEFGRVLAALRDTAQLLDGMNAQFNATQSGLHELLSLARRATAEQMALGKSQVEELTTLVRGLMSQLNDTAGVSVAQMAGALTAVVHDLSAKVSDLGERMAGAVATSAQQASGAAATVIERANAWSASNTEQLSELLARHRAHMRQVDELRDNLDATLVGVRDILRHYTTLTADLRAASADLKSVATAAAAATQAMKEATDTVQRLVGIAERQAERMAEAYRQQDDVWQRMQSGLRQYQQIFAQVEQAAGQLFVQIDQSLHAYREAVRKGFEDVVQAADGQFKHAVQRLGASIDDLDDTLQHLNEILDEARRHGADDERR